MPTSTQVMGGRNLFMELVPVSKDRRFHSSVILTGDFSGVRNCDGSLARLINHSFLVNTTE